jgi:hypothetical protein
MEAFTKLKTIIVPLLAALAVATGCATPDTRLGSDDHRPSLARSTEGYYAVVDSIEPRISGAHGEPHRVAAGYLIRVRFDDRTFKTVAQADLDGLRVGDSVRIEHDRVRPY